jgi:hypothetical protein
LIDTVMNNFFFFSKFGSYLNLELGCKTLFNGTNRGTYRLYYFGMYVMMNDKVSLLDTNFFFPNYNQDTSVEFFSGRRSASFLLKR